MLLSMSYKNMMYNLFCLLVYWQTEPLARWYLLKGAAYAYTEAGLSVHYAGVLDVPPYRY